MSLEIQTQKITISLYEKKNLNNTNIINNLFSVNIPSKKIKNIEKYLAA